MLADEFCQELHDHYGRTPSGILGSVLNELVFVRLLQLELMHVINISATLALIGRAAKAHWAVPWLKGQAPAMVGDPVPSAPASPAAGASALGSAPPAPGADAGEESWEAWWDEVFDGGILHMVFPFAARTRFSVCRFPTLDRCQLLSAHLKKYAVQTLENTTLRLNELVFVRLLQLELMHVDIARSLRPRTPGPAENTNYPGVHDGCVTLLYIYIYIYIHTGVLIVLIIPMCC